MKDDIRRQTCIIIRKNGRYLVGRSSIQGIMALALGTDDELEAEIKAYKDILNGVKEQPTIPHDMKWNPDCKDCLPEGIEDCIECHKRMEGR